MREGWHAVKTLERRLTLRERQIVRLMAVGWNNRAIADQMLISVRVVEHHINGIFRKVDCDEYHVPRVWIARGVWEGRL